MSTVNFNDDLSLALPFGWGSKELREEGKRVLRIVGPGAGSYVSDSRDYPCDIRLSVSKPVEKSIDDMDFPAKLKENSAKAPDILAYMEPDTLYTAQDITNSVPSVVAAGLSGNRVTAMLTQLVNDGKLVKTIENRTAYYSLD